MITLDVIRAAQNNDLSAAGEVVAATEERVARLAKSAASRMSPAGGARFADFVEEFTQVGRIAVWEALSRFAGASVDDFLGFVHSTVSNALKDAARSEMNGAAGVDKDATKVFAQMLAMADGDVFLAERMARTVPPAGQRLSADRAEAARLAWVGTYSIDRSHGHNAQSEGASKMPGGIADILRSTYGIPEDLLTPEDINSEQRRQRNAIVRAIIDSMGDNQANVLKHSFGIGDVTFYGHGASGDDEGLAAELGLSVKQVRDAREKGLKAFAKRYIRAVAHDKPQLAASLEAAAAVNLSRGGRK